MFTHLRTLASYAYNEELNIKNFLPQMRFLTSLSLIYSHIEQFDYIYENCRSLRTLKFNFYCKDNVLINNFETIIETVKSDIIQKAFSLTLQIENLKIQTAVQVMKRLEEESEVT